jgi:RNA polymerase sigma-32 factor
MSIEYRRVARQNQPDFLRHRVCQALASHAASWAVVYGAPMATRKAARGGKAKREVIDVGDDAAARRGRDEGDPEDAAESGEDQDEEREGKDDGDVEADLLGTSAVIDISSGDEDEPAASGDGDGDSEVVELDAPALTRPSAGLPARRDPLAVYMSETRRFPLLTPDEEHSLAVRLVEHGDNVAARRLVESNLRLVVKIAYEYRRAHKNLLDLVQEGNIGLMNAVRKFDPYRGVKLSSYAAFWIRAYILKFILNNWRLVKIGTTQAQRKLFFNLRKEREKLEQLGFQPTAALLAEKLDVSEQEVVDMERRLAAPEASLDAPVGNDDDGARSRLDYLPGTDRPDKSVEQSEFSELLRGKLEIFAKTLECREESIFRERWLTEDPLTLQELGDRYGVSRERARQLEKRLLNRLRKYLEEELGSAVDIGAMIRE